MSLGMLVWMELLYSHSEVTCCLLHLFLRDFESSLVRFCTNAESWLETVIERLAGRQG